MTKLETVAALVGKQLEERDKPVGLGLEIPRQLKQDRSSLFAQQRQPIFQQLEAVHGIFRQALPVRYEFRCLPRENEILASLLAPGCHGLRRRGSIEHAVELGCRKLAGIILKLV